MCVVRLVGAITTADIVVIERIKCLLVAHTQVLHTRAIPSKIYAKRYTVRIALHHTRQQTAQ